jgi:Cyclophilin type peptidyl-prolyl cis-trans isomerase/CLD
MTLRDEVNRRGLTRGNLSWALAGLDTGRPGYTLGVTPQPHNEGDFTALGRVIRGLDVVDRLELGDAVTAARIMRRWGIPPTSAPQRRRFLFRLDSNDPRAFVAAVATLSIAALVASAIPARRAASVDPMVALRAE